jgi:hypothetical protein
MIKPNELSYHGYDYNGQPKFSKSGRTQNWEIGNTVKVGFLTLVVKEIKGNKYILENLKGVLYSFEPHYGITRL